MDITAQLTDTAILEAIGTRIRDHRIEAGLTQAELADEAGVAKRTLERLERGEGSELVTLVRVLRELGLVEGFGRLVREIAPGPIEQLERGARRRKRVAHPRKERPKAARRGAGTWTWKE